MKEYRRVSWYQKEQGQFPISQFLQGKDATDKEEVIKVAKSYNEYYVSVGANLASAVPPIAVEMVDDRNH